MTLLHVATLNIRNLQDRWAERLPLLLADAAGLQPDVFGLQEVVFPMQQDRLVGASGAMRYEAFRCPAQQPEAGNSLLVRKGLAVEGAERLDLGLGRAALRATIVLADGLHARVTVTHLHHPPDAREERDRQATALLEWLDEGVEAGAGAAAGGGSGASRSDVQIVMGDFNADPQEPAYARMTAAGFRSAHLEANGREPAITWPSGIVAPGMDTDGEPDCLDYIWVRGPASVTSCRVVFDRPAVDDPTLYPSDHFGLSAMLETGS